MSKAENNIVGIIQCRIGSTRLPRKALIPIHGIELINWVTTRVLSTKNMDKLVVAIPDSSENDRLVEVLDQSLVQVFKGSESNVFERMYLAPKETKATHIVRICADNPLISGQVIDTLIEEYFKSNADYVYNHVPKDDLFPDGLGAEMVSMKVMDEIANSDLTTAQQEHCFNYIWDNPNKFSIKTFDPENVAHHRPDIKLDIDTPDDLKTIRNLELSITSTVDEIIEEFDRVNGGD